MRRPEWYLYHGFKETTDTPIITPLKGDYYLGNFYWLSGMNWGLSGGDQKRLKKFFNL